MGFSKFDVDNEQQLIDAFFDPPAPSYNGFNRDQHPLPYILSKTRDGAELDQTDQEFIAELTKQALMLTDDGQELKRVSG